MSIVVKFGGTSVGDAAAIVRSRLARHPVVVVSAMAGVTSDLLRLTERACRGDGEGAAALIAMLRKRHALAAAALLGDAGALEMRTAIDAICDELKRLCLGLSVLGECPSRGGDAIASAGERLSARLVTAVFRARGIPAVEVDARALIVTDATFGRAEPVQERIAAVVPSTLDPLLQRDIVPVVGGFIGATEDGTPTTLGRGGSDYSAALIGAALGAGAIEIWTDVDGMLTADPRVVPGARNIPHLGFEEAAELATFGAKVLHPRTVAPAVRLGIPVHIYDSRDGGGCGTRIAHDAPRRAMTAIAGRAGICAIKVRSSRMLDAHGFLHRLFGVFAAHRLAVDVVTTSEVSVSVTIEERGPLERLLAELSALGDVELLRDCALVAVVGSELTRDVRVVARAIGALGEMAVHMLSVSASGTNVTAVIDAADLERAMRQMHAALFEGSESGAGIGAAAALAHATR